MLLHQVLLRRAVLGQSRYADNDQQATLLTFVDTVVPHILLKYARIPALGGSVAAKVLEDESLPPNLRIISTNSRERFTGGHDQSLATHILNGIFAGVRMAQHLPESKCLDETELSVWLLAFVVHDYTKVYGIDIAAGKLPEIRQIITRLGETLHFAEFLRDWLSYLDDITFLAQNIQKKAGANLNQADYPEHRLSWRRNEILRLLGSYADILVHITDPADVVQRDARGRDTAHNLRFTLAALCGDNPPRLAYHKLTEVRGLISNLINNAVTDVLQAQGFMPYLFFPDGVVYITERTKDATIEINDVIEVVWNKIAGALMGSDAQKSEDSEEESEFESEDSGGLRISRTKDYMKVPPVLYEILSLPKLLVAGKAAAMRIRNALTVERLGSEIAEQQGLITNTLSLKDKKALFAQTGQPYAQAEGLPTDVRADQLAEFLGFVQRRVLKEFFPKADWTGRVILEALSLEDITPARAEAQRSGTPTGWFYVAARYLKANPNLDPDGIEQTMQRLSESVLRFLHQHGVEIKSRNTIEQSFRSYLAGVVMVDGQPIGRGVDDIMTLVEAELKSYIERKATNKEQCTLCSSPYECTPQDISVVLFKGQQYSNKAKLDTSKVIRGICPICAIEMMLRQVQQGMPAKTAQDEKPIQVYLYPTYFFTTETAYVIKLFIRELRDLSMLGLIYKHLEPNGFGVDQVLSYEQYTVDDQAAQQTQRRTFSLKKPQYSDNDPAGLFFFALRPAMKKPTDTDSWIVPTFYALALPLLLNVKVVVSSSFVPLYSSGSQFKETAILDAPHSFTKYVLPTDHFRVDQLDSALIKLLRLYQLHLDVFAEPTDMHWPQLSMVAKDVATDPYYVFSYYERKQRKSSDEGGNKAKKKQTADAGTSKGIPPLDVRRYLAIYTTLGGQPDMGFIGKLVDAYAAFYRADNLDAAYAVLRPLMTAMDVTVDSSPNTERDDLLLLVTGALNDDQERVRGDRETQGFDPIITNKSLGDYGERLQQSRQAILSFADMFLTEAFENYCEGDRGILRERANRLRSAARFHYLINYAPKRKSKPDAPAQQ